MKLENIILAVLVLTAFIFILNHFYIKIRILNIEEPNYPIIHIQSALLHLYVIESRVPVVVYIILVITGKIRKGESFHVLKTDVERIQKDLHTSLFWREK